MRTTYARSFAALLLAAVSAAHAAEPSAHEGSLQGHVVLDVEGIDVAGVGPLVVYLDGIDGDIPYRVPSDVPRISQKNAQFSPAFLVVARGQTVLMPNDDSIFHNVFSYSKPNELDLGLYPKGEWRSVTFRAPGVVRLYCSIHESMSATVFVAPSPYHATADPDGAFVIRGVPAGQYRVRTWNQKLPEGSRPVEVVAGRSTEADVHVGAPPARE